VFQVHRARATHDCVRLRAEPQHASLIAPAGNVEKRATGRGDLPSAVIAMFDETKGRGRGPRRGIGEPGTVERGAGDLHRASGLVHEIGERPKGRSAHPENNDPPTSNQSQNRWRNGRNQSRPVARSSRAPGAATLYQQKDDHQRVSGWKAAARWPMSNWCAARKPPHPGHCRPVAE